MRLPTPNPPPANLAGSLLLAHPTLRDPNFRRTVVLMSVHTDEGAMGVVLNRPLNKRLGEINGSYAYGPLADVPVFSGGPVQLDQLILVAWQRHSEGFRLHFGVEFDHAKELISDESTSIRAYVGYSGWEGGQLEGELRNNAWVVSPMMPDLLDQSPTEDLWRLVLGGISPEWKLLAGEPDDPSFN